MKNKAKIWKIPKPNPALQEIFSLKLGVSKVVAQILVNRGITTVDEARAFLFTEENLPAPFLMKDMDKAVTRIQQAIKNQEKIRIFGDYDVDGITSTAIMMHVLANLGGLADFYIPARLTEGYGMNREAVAAAKHDGVALIITVDSGIASANEVDMAQSMGMDVIVTDHHEPPPVVPRALAVINPKQGDCPYPFKDLAGAGVAYKLAGALLQSNAYHPDEDASLPGKLIELACLGTVADIVSLKGENRLLVKNGLAAMAQTSLMGLRALMDRCGIKQGEINSRQVAFQISPRINAAGRLGDASCAVRLLLSENVDEAAALAVELCALNEQRQHIEEVIYREALQTIESGGINPEKDKVLVLARAGWHLGVIGIVASKLVQDFSRPVIMMNIEGDMAKGSARSIPAFDLFQALLHHAEYMEKFGGHKQAAGLTMPVCNVETFAAAINNYADERLAAEELLPEIYVDCEVELQDINEELYRQLQMLAPYGADNPAPVIACRQAGIMDYRTVGADGSHLKMKVYSQNLLLDAIGFHLGTWQQMISQSDYLDIAFALEKNEWNGRSTLQLNIKDLRPYNAALCFGEQKTAGEISFIEELFQNAITYLVDDYYRDIGDKEEFYTKIVGVTFENRQAVVAGLRDGEQVFLERETNNPYDANAVKVLNGSGTQIGYLNARLAKYFAPLLDKGEEYLAGVSQVTGGQDKNYGVNIVISKNTEETRKEYELRLARVREDLAQATDDELIDRIRQALLGEHPFREKQLAALDNLFGGHKTLAIFGTGRGKSAVFQTMAAFKAIRNREMTVIIYPLRALVNDQYENMSARLSPLGLRVFKGNGSISAGERARLFDAIAQGGVDVLLTTPEFISYHLAKIQAAARKTGFFVVDECHHIGMSSKTHRPHYQKLGELVMQLGEPAVLAVTATAGQEVADEIIRTLGIEKVVIDPHVRSNLQLVDKRDWPDKNGYLRRVVGTGDKTVIYVNSRLQTVELAAMLRESLPKMGDRIIFYHAGLNSEQRNTIERMFRHGQVSTVVSTSAFGEGIDIPDVKHIVIFHLNFNFTEFNQQCGRCGRDGEEALIHLLCGRRDAAINRFILEASAPSRENLGKLYTVLREMAAKSQPVTQTNDDIARTLKRNGLRYARPGFVSAGLGILEELQLIQRESVGRERQIYLLPAPGQKLDIENSLRYMEGQEEKLAFKDFEEYFFKASPDELLRFVNRPIYPQKYLSHEDKRARK